MWKLSFEEVKWKQNRLPGLFIITPDFVAKLLCRNPTHSVHSLPTVERFILLEQFISRIGTINNCSLVSIAQWMPIKMQGFFSLQALRSQTFTKFRPYFSLPSIALAANNS